MSVSIFPCRGCPLRIGCGQRAEFTRRASGIGARSVAFKCAAIEREIRPGRRVIIRQPVAVAGRGWDDDGFHVRHVEVTATITSVGKHYAFASTVDADSIKPHLDRELIADYPEAWKDQYRFRRSQAHRRIVRFIDEPDRAICENGARVLTSGSGPAAESACDKPEGADCYCRQVL